MTAAMGIGLTAGLYVVFLAVGIWSARRYRSNDADDFMVAGRKLPLLVATMTMTATWVDGGYLLGTAEGAQRSLASAWQGGGCFGISLILGGLFFARIMRRMCFRTLVDPFAARYGHKWAAVLLLPALLGEIFWSAELLVALGSTMQVLFGIGIEAAIVASAVVVTAYTMLGGLWSVAYTDAVQLGLIPVGLCVAVPFAFSAAGGWTACWERYVQSHGEAARLVPPMAASRDFWTGPMIVGWWDLSVMLMFGGIPWNCYFQRVLGCQSPRTAAWHSILAGILTIALTLPPMLLGIAASSAPWPPQPAALLAKEPAAALPLVLGSLVPVWVSLLGLAAIIGAVTSSYSSSVLSAASMLGWNVARSLVWPAISSRQLAGLLRAGVLLLGAVSAWMAIRVQSVQQLWFLTSDLVFVLLFPQLVMVLFDRRANRTGSITAFLVSLAIRGSAGEPLLGIPPVMDYSRWGAAWFGGSHLDWTDAATGITRFPIRAVAAAVGLFLLPIVSRCTAHWDPPHPLVELGDQPAALPGLPANRRAGNKPAGAKWK